MEKSAGLWNPKKTWPLQGLHLGKRRSVSSSCPFTQRSSSLVSQSTIISQSLLLGVLLQDWSSSPPNKASKNMPKTKASWTTSSVRFPTVMSGFFERPIPTTPGPPILALGSALASSKARTSPKWCFDAANISAVHPERSCNTSDSNFQPCIASRMEGPNSWDKLSFSQLHNDYFTQPTHCLRLEGFSQLGQSKVALLCSNVP